jgi:hypothetical protein
MHYKWDTAMAKSQTRLPTLQEHTLDATTMTVCGGGTAFSGRDLEGDLVCGGCGMVLFEDMSLYTLTRTIVTRGPFIITCGRCGVHNVAQAAP